MNVEEGNAGVEKVSIIIPAYNMQKYVDRCLESILKQTYTNIEIICVDDGSTDATGSILEKYKLQDSRVQLYHIANAGVSGARNYALERMTGDWFSFVDADDWVEPDFVQRLYDNAKQYNCDVSVCSFQKNEKYAEGYDKKETQMFFFSAPKECVCNFICEKNSMEGMSWNKLYRAEMFGDIRFDERLSVNEDCLYTYEVMTKCDKACMTTARLYHWFWRKDSASHIKNVKSDFSSARVFLDLYEKTRDYADDETTGTLQVNYILAVSNVLLYARYKKKDEEVQDVRKQCLLWKRDVWHLLDFKAKLKYILAVKIKWMFHF